MVRFSWIIVVLPLVSFFVILLFGKRMPRGGAEVGIVAVLASFVLSLLVASHFWGGNNGPYEAGITWVNSWFLRDLRTPFGGVGLSGIGREGGTHSLDFYSQLNNVCIKI